MQHIQAFTKEYNKEERCLLSDVRLIVDRKNVKVEALWDTGATDSCISKILAEKLRLKPTGCVPMQTASGKRDAFQYLVSIILPNNLIVQDIVVNEIEIQDHGLLIGMDIISTGDFAVSNYGKKSFFTFRRPSLEVLDFEKQLKRK